MKSIRNYLQLAVTLLLLTTFFFTSQVSASSPKNQLVTNDSETFYYDSKGKPVTNEFVTIKKIHSSSTKMVI